MKEGWLKILNPVTLEITIFREKKIRILSGRLLIESCDKTPFANILKLQKRRLVNTFWRPTGAHVT